MSVEEFLTAMDAKLADGHDYRADPWHWDSADQPRWDAEKVTRFAERQNPPPCAAWIDRSQPRLTAADD